MGAGSCVDLRWVCCLMGGAGGFGVLLGFWVCAHSLGDVGGLMLVSWIWRGDWLVWECWFVVVFPGVGD